MRRDDGRRCGEDVVDAHAPRLRVVEILKLIVAA
jgi:hypothetical protein